MQHRIYPQKLSILTSYILTNMPHGFPASFFRRQAQVFSPALKRADCLSEASFCPLAGENTGVAGKTQP